jgi:hypothetical protein
MLFALPTRRVRRQIALPVAVAVRGHDGGALAPELVCDEKVTFAVPRIHIQFTPGGIILGGDPLQPSLPVIVGEKRAPARC